MLVRATLAALALALPPAAPAVKLWAGTEAHASARVTVAAAPSNALTARVAPTSAVFRYFGAHPATAGTGYPRKFFLAPNNVTGRDEAPPWFVTFNATGRFSIVTRGGRGQYRLIVDNHPVTARPSRPLPGDGRVYTVNVATAGRHSIVVEMTGNFWFGGVVGSVARSTVKLGPRTIFLGDSFTEPTGADAAFDGYATLAGFMLGWGDVWASGSGGTGYLNNGPAGRVNFGRRFQSDVLRYNPDIVVLAGGINDVRYSTPEQIATAAQRLIQRCGNRKVIVLSPWWSHGDKPDYVTATTAELQAVAQQTGAAFVDVSGWRYPTIDGTHPTQTGHRQIAQQLAAAISALP